MTAKEYLSQVGKIQNRIKCLSEQVQFMRDAAESVSSVISDMPRSPNRNISRMENSVIRIVDMETKLQTELDKLDIANRLISALPEPKWQDIIIKRYLNTMRWDEIFSEVDLSPRQTYRLHDLALSYIDNLLADGSEWQLMAVGGSPASVSGS